MCSGSRGARSRVEFETRAIHAGQEPDPLTGSVNVPIYQTSTYAQDGVLQMRGGHDYARTINPTRTALEQCLASLEGGAHGVASRPGMGATTAIMELFAPGSRTVAINDVYGGTYRLFSKLYEPKGYAYEYVDLTDEGVRAAGLRASRPTSSGSRRRRTRCSRSSTSRRSPSARTRRARSSSSTTPSPARTSSSRSRSAPTSSCTRPPSTSAATPTSVGGAAVTNDAATRRAAALRAELDRRGAGPARLLPHAARRQDARACAWSATATTPRRSRAGSPSRSPSARSITRA